MNKYFLSGSECNYRLVLGDVLAKSFFQATFELKRWHRWWHCHQHHSDDQNSAKLSFVPKNNNFIVGNVRKSLYGPGNKMSRIQVWIYTCKYVYLNKLNSKTLNRSWLPEWNWIRKFQTNRTDIKNTEKLLQCTIVSHRVGLHRCWWRMWETKCVGDNLKMLVTVLAIEVTIIF